jgi:DNA-binding transcriptional LysR family regulator
VLTEMGEMFSRRAGAAFNELNRAREEIAQHQGDVQGRIVTCLSSLTHIALLPAALTPFRKRYPLVELGLIEGAYPMVERRWSMAPSTSSSARSAIRSSRPGSGRRSCSTTTGSWSRARDHPLQNATSLAELIESDWITTSITNDPEAEFNDLFLGHGLPPPRLAPADGDLPDDAGRHDQHRHAGDRAQAIRALSAGRRLRPADTGPGETRRPVAVSHPAGGDSAHPRRRISDGPIAARRGKAGASRIEQM